LYSVFFSQFHVDLRDLHSFLHDALPISRSEVSFFTKCNEFISNFTEFFSSFFSCCNAFTYDKGCNQVAQHRFSLIRRTSEFSVRSEEHTSELQSRFDLVCRLLLEKKNK